MRVKTFYWVLRLWTAVVLFFFVWTFGPLWQAVAFAAISSKADAKAQTIGKPAIGKQKPEEKLEGVLDAIREHVNKAGDIATRSADETSELDAIKARKGELDNIDVELRAEFAETGAKLKASKLPQQILDRHATFVKNYETNLAQLKSEIDDVDKAKTKADRRTKIEKARLHLEKVKTSKKHKPFNPNRLPARTRQLKPVQTSWLDKAMELLIPTAEAADNPPTSADLAETLETPQTQEIRDLAQRLGGSSVSLYEYVRNAYSYEPYAGSVKGGVQTLREKSGNEWDQASLLISLYRASGIPARYVVGTVDIPVDAAMSWLGVEDPIMAGTLLLTMGRPTSLVYSGSKITYIRTQQIWVRAYVPFLYSRGATTGPGDMWVDIDPSFKGQTVTKTLTVAGAPEFDQSAYLSSFRTESPFDFYKTQLQTFLDNSNPGYVPEALAWDYEITPERFGVLIGQPKYIIKTVTGTYTEIPDPYRQKFTLSITDLSSGDILLSYSAPMPQIIGKRMTLSYIPATTADAAVIDNYGGLYSTPPYLVNIKPEIRIDGISAIQGDAIGAGQEQNMEFIFDTTIDQGRVENTIISGGYYAIGLSARSGDTQENILERTNQLATLAGTIDFNDPATLDQKLGEILYLSATVYHQNLDSITRKIASLDHVVDVRDVSEMMYMLILKVDSVFGVPRKIKPVGITGDMDRNLHTIVPVDGDMNRIKPFMQQTGNVSSFLEHDVTEKIYQTQALSSVKGIQLAHDQGIPVHTITGQNISTELPVLQLSPELKFDIVNAVNAGQEVVVPERDLSLGIWTGVGYIVQDSISGKAAYLISGGYGGIVTVQNDATEDLARATMVEVAAQAAHATYRIQICYPGPENLNNVCYTLYAFGELDDDCGRQDPECRGKYYYPHDDFVQYLIDIRDKDEQTFLTKHIKAKDWQSQDHAPYMRAGRAVMVVIESLMSEFHVKGHKLGTDGSGYRTRLRNETLARQHNTRVSYSSHHMDGVAADIILSDPEDGYQTPEKCKVLPEAYKIVANGETLHEGTLNSVHIAKPGYNHTDESDYVWSCWLDLD